MTRLHLLDSACACTLSGTKDYDKKVCDSLLQRLDINDGLDTNAIVPKQKPQF